MGLFAWIVVGFVAGAFARSVTGFDHRPERPSRLGCLGTIAVGVLGGVIGGALTSAATGEGIGDFGLRSIAVAFVGAVLLLFVLEAIAGRRHQG